jgi:hypothetical protein
VMVPFGCITREEERWRMSWSLVRVLLYQLLVSDFVLRHMLQVTQRMYFSLPMQLAVCDYDFLYP